MTSFKGGFKMHIWQIQEAKAKFTQLIREARTEPQIISRHGVPETVTISIDKYEELTGQKGDIISFFQNSPLHGIKLDLARDHSLIREVEL
jgi:prevent-host-death family protein